MILVLRLFPRRFNEPNALQYSVDASYELLNPEESVYYPLCLKWGIQRSSKNEDYDPIACIDQWLLWRVLLLIPFWNVPQLLW